jgi:titin
LEDANLSGASLVNVNLTSADLRRANLSGALLSNVDLTGALLGGATLTDVVSSGIIGTPAELPAGWEIASGSLVRRSAPAAPRIGIAVAGNGQVTVSWTAPADDGGSPVVGYVVTVFPNGTTGSQITFDSTDTTQVMTGLTNGSRYQFAVEATNEIGRSPISALSNVATPMTGVPPSPTMTAAVATGDSIVVTWIAPTDDGGSPITGYILVARLANAPSNPPVYTEEFDSTDTTETLTALTDGTSYVFTVVALNANGPGPESNVSQPATPLAQLPPSAPTGAQVSESENCAPIVSWTTPNTFDRPPVTGFVVTPYLGLAPQAPRIFISTYTSQAIAGLAPGMTYRFKVAAINTVGVGAFSKISNPVATPTSAPPPGISCAPVRQTTTVTMVSYPGDYIGQGQAGYFSPDNATISVLGGTDDLKVKVTGGSVGGFFNFEFAPPAGNQLVAGFYDSAQRAAFRAPGHPGMDIYGDYAGCNTISGRFQVFDIGFTDGLLHAWIAYEQHCEGYGPPLIGELRINEPLPAPDLSITQEQVWWPDTAVGANSAVVPVSVFNTGRTAVSIGSPELTGDETDFAVVADSCGGVILAAGNSCSVQLRFSPTVAGARTAQLSIPNSDNGAVVIPLSGFAGSPSNRSTPDPVTGLTATAVAGGTMLRWTNPTSNFSHAIVRAFEAPAASTDPTIGQLLGTTTGTTTRVTGLREGVSYTASVFALDGQGDVAPPATVQFTCCNPPSAPGISTISPGNNRVTVSWIAPVSSRAGPITGYIVTPYIGSTAQMPVQVPASSLTATLSGLTNGQTYSCTVAAVNVAGVGAESVPSDPVTPARIPDAPAIGSATAGNGQITLSWTPPISDGGSPIAGYIVTAYVGYTPVKLRIFASTNTTQTIGGLTDGTQYRFRVRAYSAMGISPYSKVSKAVTPTE